MNNKNTPPLVIRADASTDIGFGHVMRCLALAQSWQDTGGTVTLVMVNPVAVLARRLRVEGIEVVPLAAEPGSPDDAVKTADIARRLGAAWLVVDGYHFGAAYQRAIKDNDLRLLFIDDDGHTDFYSADLVLNQNIYAHENLYQARGSNTQLLLGSKYVLLRQEFRQGQNGKDTISDETYRVLVTLGGAASENRLLKIIQALPSVKVDGLEAIAVVSAENGQADKLQSAIGQFPSVQLMSDVTNMHELMAWADCAISAAGTTCLELAFMGTPALLVITAVNQIGVAKGMEQAGAAQNLGWFADLNEELIGANLQTLLADVAGRQTMSFRGRELIDGHGAGRVVAALTKNNRYLRPVSTVDCRLLWNWANDPRARLMAINTAQIPFEDHQHWFEQKLNSAETSMFILEREATPVGQIRFDLEQNGEAEINFYIAPEHRSQSLGTFLLRAGVQRYLESNHHRAQTVAGYVRPENSSSCRVFEKAGFLRSDTDVRQDVKLIRFVWPNGDAR